jgi:hypothetical protein
MFRLISFVAILAISIPAHSQSPSQALATCLADNTTGKDRKELAKWVFLGMAAHPEMKQYTNANASTAVDDSARTVAAIVSRLVTSACVNEFKNATKQGAQAIPLAFESLGRLAMTELTADKSVSEAMGVFADYLDQKRLEAVLGAK